MGVATHVLGSQRSTASCQQSDMPDQYGVDFWFALGVTFAVGIALGVGMALKDRMNLAMYFVIAMGLFSGLIFSTIWDRNLRTNSLGVPADSQIVQRLQAQNRAAKYLSRRNAWLAMNDSQRWRWRIVQFCEFGGAVLVGGIPAVRITKRRYAAHHRAEMQSLARSVLAGESREIS